LGVWSRPDGSRAETNPNHAGFLYDPYHPVIVRPILVPAYLILINSGRLGRLGRLVGARVEASEPGSVKAAVSAGCCTNLGCLK
jgi:hypothetical protein